MVIIVKRNLKFSIITICTIVAIFIGVIVMGYSYAATLESGVRVKENSDLTYYIDVIYDGKDENLVMSSDTATAEVRSGYIYVEDKIPDGLTFKEFVQSEDGTIGAVQRGDTSKTCTGYVVDGVSGLVYDDATRTVSFKVKNLQAGCKITVGIVTTTPTLAQDETRKDFYNTAFAQEGTFSASSNTVHAFIGEPEASLYSVEYKYTGDVPEGAPELPTVSSYASGTTVGVLNDIELDGYIFSGWTTTDVEVTNNSFTMPESTVTFTGSFTAKPKYSVSYVIDESSQQPEGYLPPDTKEYGEGDTVYVDSLAENDTINGYRFLGWTTTDVTVLDDSFVMPATQVTFIGRFVTYKFQGDTLPENADALLPETNTYYPEDTVQLAPYPVSEGYKFLGWYHADNFKMPEENITIYGEWKLEAGTFKPTITTTIIDPKEYYHENDIVQFKTTVTNTAEFNIRDVMIQSTLEGNTFTIPTDGTYTVLSEQFVKIPTLPANTSIDIYGTYTAGTSWHNTYTNTLILNGALADNNYTLDTTEEYKAESNFTVTNITLQINKVDEDNNKLTKAEFSLYSDVNKTNLVSTGLKFEKLLPNTTYYLEETKAQAGYMLLGKTLELKVGIDGTLTIDNNQITVQDGVGNLDILATKVNILPNTGGKGNVPYIIIGMIVIVIGTFGYLYYLKKKRSDNK